MFRTLCNSLGTRGTQIMLKISLVKAGREIHFQRQADMAGPAADLAQVENVQLGHYSRLYDRIVCSGRGRTKSLCRVIEYPSQESFGARSAYSL